MLNQVGKRLKGIQADPVWTRATDGQIRPTELSRARQPFLNAPGKTTPELRQTIEAFVVTQRGQSRPETAPVPDELTPYLQKLALTAYKITDKNFNDLRSAGYEDEVIYEITVTGAFGAALVGVEKLFDVLYG